jgi:5'-3' exonuclease
VINFEKPAWLIDSSIYVFKAWHTQPDRSDIHGNPINAVIGFLDFAYHLLSVEKPELIAFAFDESLTTSHRKAIYPEYKANRAVAPKSLRLQFRLCRDFIRALGIHQGASHYYEADDLIGTWANSLHQNSIPVNIITADKDLAQLVHQGDHWWEYLCGEKLDTQKITKRFRAKPRQIADQLAIAGDKSDNIPGVPGVGISTAGKLLRKFDNLENLLTNISDISSMQIRGAVRIQQLINDHQENIRLARKLTGIVCDIETVSQSDFSIAEIDDVIFEALCEQLDFSIESQEKWRRLQSELHLIKSDWL